MGRSGYASIIFRGVIVKYVLMVEQAYVRHISVLKLLALNVLIHLECVFIVFEGDCVENVLMEDRGCVNMVISKISVCNVVMMLQVVVFMVRSVVCALNSTGICIHKKTIYHCIECYPQGFCPHQKRWRNCAECDGSGLCDEHKKEKSKCIDCFGSSYCHHRKLRSRCRECGGVSYCKEHNRRKDQCPECNACVHGKNKIYCRLCDGRSLCRNCHFTSAHYGGYQYCRNCYYQLHPELDPPPRLRTKEKHLLKTFNEDEELQGKFAYDNRIQGGCSGRRPDFFFECLTHSVIVENDEHQHISVECENKRMMEIFASLGSRPLIMIRFNPDSYVDKSGIRHPGAFKRDRHRNLLIIEEEFNRRYTILKKALTDALSVVPTKNVTECKLFYNEEEKKEIEEETKEN
jgi:hypothetical protein